MVKLRFVVRNGKLTLRFSEGKERFYRAVTSSLIGNPNIHKHWDDDKERFTRVAVCYVDNNKALADIKAKYLKVMLDHPELSAKEVADYYDNPQKPKAPKIEGDLFVDYLEKVIEREKLKDGCNFENYDKLLKKIRKLFPELMCLTFQELTYDRCAEIADLVATQPGYFGTMKSFRNTLGKASKDRNVKFSITQIEGFKFQDFDPEKDVVKDKDPDVLTQDQVRAFMELDPSKLDYWSPRRSQLFHDFSVFMLHTMMAPCDVFKLKDTNITSRGTIATRRTKTHRAVEVPITPVMHQIIDKYAGISKQGYIFPAMDEEKDKKSKTRNYVLKKFREDLNKWLKIVGKELGVPYPLYAYVFRHTAITMAIDSGLPIAYVSAVAGTGIDMIQDHYYNPGSITNSDKLQAMFMKAAGCA